MRSPARLVRGFLRQSPPRRRLFLLAGSVLVIVRLSLWLLPSRVLLRHVDARVRKVITDGGPAVASVQDVVWAVEAASRRLPQTTCLTQALTTQLLLARSGHSSALRIGVARPADGSLKAHAWVEHEGKVLIGDVDLDQYTLMPDLRKAL